MGPKQDDTQLYLRIATKMAVDLPDEKDRVLALKWLKFMQKSEEPAAKKTRLHAIQLLLMCLQRKRLVGPFNEAPDATKKLLQYGWAYQPADIARLILKSELEKLAKAQFFVEVSGDMSEYLAGQEIPQFGAHFYYAYSPEPVSQWEGLNMEYIPKGFLAMSATESPVASILAGAVAEAMNEKKRALAARIVVPQGQKRSKFTKATMLDEKTGALHEEFLKEVPASKSLSTKLMQNAMKRGVVEIGDLALPSEIAGKRRKKAPGDGVQIDAPHVEGIEVKDGDVVISKSQQLKNAASKKIKKKTKKAFDAIQEEEDEEAKAKAELERKAKEQEAQRQELLAKMPPALRKRMMEHQKKKEKKEREEKLKTPEALRKGAKAAKFKKVYKPEDFGLSAKEQFGQAIDVFGQLEYTSPPPTRKTVWVGKDLPSAERQREKSRLGLTGPSRLKVSPALLAAQAKGGAAPRTPEADKSFLTKEIEASWDRGVKEMLSKRVHSETRKSQSPARKEALERLDRLKTIQPRKIIFDDMDIEIEPEEKTFEKFIYTEFSDEDRTPSILEETKMGIDDLFAEGQESPSKHLNAPVSPQALEKAAILLETEMETEDVFQQADVASPAVVFKEITVEGERLVSPTHPSESPREGGIKVGKRVVEIPGQEPMQQHYIEQYGDVVFNESLRAVDPPLDPISYTPPKNDEIFNRYLDQKLKKLQPGEAPRVYGPWAKSFKQELERLERGEELEFPEEDAAQYVYPHDHDKSVLSESEMEDFEKQKTGIPSPVIQAEAEKQSALFSQLKTRHEVNKARKIQKQLTEPEDKEDDFQPTIYDTPPTGKPAVFDASIKDAALGLAIVEAPKQDALESFEKKLDASLALFVDDREDEPVVEPRTVYDEDFLNKRIQDGEVPADESIIEDYDDEMFDPEEVVEPRKVQDIPSVKPKSPAKGQSPVKHSHLYLPEGKYRPKVEDVVPHDFVAEQSFPEDEIAEDLDISPVESAISAITEPAAEDLSEGATEGEEAAKQSSPLRQTSPTTIALAKSIKHARDAQNLINKFRETKGLPPEELLVPFDGIAQFVDARENLLDPLCKAAILEQPPGVLDEPIIEDKLDKPLVKSPQKKDILADYEKQIMTEILEGRADELQDELLPEDAMEEDVVPDEDVAEPAPIQKICMPSPRKSTGPIDTSSPVKHSHLYLTKRPLLKQLDAPEVVPDEQLEEEEEPILEPAPDERLGLSGKYALSPEDRELLETLFDGEVPSDMAEDFSFHAPKGENVLEGDRSGYSPIMARFHDLRRRKGAPASPGSPKAPADWIPEGDLDAKDVFGEEQILSPRQVHKSPARIVVDESVRASETIQNLKNRFRKLQNLPPIEKPVDTQAVEHMKAAEEALRHILAEPVIEEPQADLEGTPKSKKTLEAFEREMHKSPQAKQKGEELGIDEMGDLFDQEAVDEPCPIKDIPVPQKSKTPSPPPPIRYSHLEAPQRYARPLPLNLEEGELGDERFPEDAYDEQLDAQGQKPPEIKPRKAKPAREESFFDKTLPQDDLFYGMLRSPDRWREPPLLQALSKAIKDSENIGVLKNKVREMQGLPPLEEDEGRRAELANILQNIHELQHIAEPQGSPATPKRFEDPFQEFEEDFKKQLNPSPQPIEKSLIDDDNVGELFGDEQILTPTRVKASPFPSPKPSPVLTPGSPKTPPRRYRPPSPVKPYKPELQSILPQEEIQEHSFPELEESAEEPAGEFVLPPQMVDDQFVPPVEPQEKEAVPAKSPEKVATEYILAKSLQVSEGYKNLKNKFRAMQGLSPVKEPLMAQHLNKYLELAGNLLEPLTSQGVAVEPGGLLDEELPGGLQDPLHPAVEKKKVDPFANYEQQLQQELFASPGPLEQSLVGEQEFQNIFPEDALATPVPIKGLPMPLKPSPVLTPRSPQTPSSTPTKPPAVPERPKLYEEPQLMDVTPPEYIHQVGVDSSPLSPARRPRIVPPEINVIPPTPPLPGSPIVCPKVPSRAPSPQKVMSPARQLSPQKVKSPPRPPSPQKVMSPPRPPSPAKLLPPASPPPVYSPIKFGFQDEIGPPVCEESPELIQFRETLPGVYEPKRDVDKERFADRQRLILANRYGISPEVIPQGMIEEVTPPKLDLSFGSPGMEAHVFDDSQVKPKQVKKTPGSGGQPGKLTPRAGDTKNLAPRQLFPPKGQLPLHMSPEERIKEFLKQQARISVQPLAKKTALSPQDFVTKVLSPREEELEDQEFPEEEKPSTELGDLAYAAYIPSEADLQDAAEIQKQRDEQFKSPLEFRKQAGPPRPIDRSPFSPIKLKDMQPDEEGFKWMENYMPFSKQVKGQRKGGIIPAELPKLKRRKSEAPRVSKLAEKQLITDTKKASLPGAAVKRPSQQLKKQILPRSASPSPPPGMAIKRPSQQIPPKQAVPPDEPTPGRPSIAKQGAKTPQKKGMKKIAPKMSAPRVATPQRRSSQPTVATPRKVPQKQSIQRPSQPIQKPSKLSVKGSETPRGIPSGVRPPPSSAQRQKVSKQATEPSEPNQPEARPRISQASILKPRTAADGQPSRKKSQVTFRSPLVPHWQSPPLAPQLLAMKFHTPEIPKKLSKVPIPGKSGIPHPSSKIPSVGRRPQKDQTPSVPTRPPQPAKRLASPKPVEKPAAPAAPVCLPTDHSAKRTYPIHEDMPAGRSKAQKPIQAASFRYSATDAPPPPVPKRAARTPDASFDSYSSDDYPTSFMKRVYASQPAPRQTARQRSRSPSPQPAPHKVASPAKDIAKMRITDQYLRNALADVMKKLNLDANRTPQQPKIERPETMRSGGATPKPKARIAIPVQKQHAPSKMVPPKVGIPRLFSLSGAAKEQSSRIAEPQVAPGGLRRSKMRLPAAKAAPSGQMAISKQAPQPPVRGKSSQVQAVPPQPPIRSGQPPARPPLPAGMRGATAEMKLTKTKTNTTLGLLKETSVVRKTALPQQPLLRRGREIAAALAEQKIVPEVDRRILTQSMMVGKVGKDSAVRKLSTIQMQHDENKAGAKMIKTNVLQSIRPGEIKKLESKFAMSHLPKSGGLPRKSGLPSLSDLSVVSGLRTPSGARASGLPKLSGLPRSSGIPKPPPRKK